MNNRENIIAALRREKCDRVPFGMSFCPEQVDKLKKVFNCEDLDDYFSLPYRYIGLESSKLKGQYDKYYNDMPENFFIDDYGVGHIPAAKIKHFSKMVHPMENFENISQIKEFPMPDLLADYRFDGFAQRVNETKEKGLFAAYGSIQIFEPAWYLRGMENLLMDMYIDSEMAEECLERITVPSEELCRKLAMADVDMIVFGDDVGTQKAMMMSTDMYRKWLKPTMRRCIQAAKEIKPDIIAFYHSDGNIEDIIEDLIEIGVDVLNPVQPECMDPIEIKEKYGDKLSFWGTIGTQTTMPFGTKEEVFEQVKIMIETVGKNGGLVIAPTHIIEPEVPLENIIAFFEAVDKYGKY